MMEEDEPNLTSPMEETFQKIKTGSNRVKLMKATLFDDDDMEVAEQPLSAPPPNVDITKLNKSRPVILEARPTILGKIKSIYRGYNQKSSRRKKISFVFSLIIILQTSVCMH